MKCTRCGSDTSVLDSRLTPENFTRRRRECTGCGHRFTTWEGRYKPDRRDRTEYFKARYAAMTPEAKRAKALRRQAQLEAKRTGEPVAAIYARWRVS